MRIEIKNGKSFRGAPGGGSKFKGGVKWAKAVRTALMWAMLSGLIYVMVYPLLFIVSTSFKSYADMLNPTTVWIPKNFTLNNYFLAFTKMGYMEAFLNTMTIAGITPLLQIASCSVAGYGFARFEFKEKKILFAMLIFTLVVPQQVVALPQFILFRTLRMANSFKPIIIPAIFAQGLKSGLFVFIFRQFFRGLPKELEEAAYIDGSGFLKTYLLVMLPNAVPAAVTVFLFSFVWHYNDIFMVSMFTTDKNLMTLPMKLVNIIGYFLEPGIVRDPVQYVPAKYAGVFLVILPVLIVYLAGQRLFVQGVERSGIVG